jgi:LysR family transcriptional regulator, glycine cleavage system transcriptional activator
MSAASGARAVLEDACAELRGTTRRPTSATVPLSTMWLAQRLAEFSALYPTTPINAIIQLAEPDYSRYGIDLAIEHVPEKMLFDGRRVPTCGASCRLLSSFDMPFSRSVVTST